MAAGLFNVTGSYQLEGYASWRTEIQIVTQGGTPIPLDDFVSNGLRAQFRPAGYDSQVVAFDLSKKTQSAQYETGVIIVTPASQGVVLLTISHQDSEAAQDRGWIAGDWDLVGLANNAGNGSPAQYRPRLIEGAWSLNAGITRI